jgi:hypothetical protein
METVTFERKLSCPGMIYSYDLLPGDNSAQIRIVVSVKFCDKFDIISVAFPESVSEPSELPHDSFELSAIEARWIPA